MCVATFMLMCVCMYMYLPLVLSVFLALARAGAFSLISGEKQCLKLSVECMDTVMLDKVQLVVTSPLTRCIQVYHIHL